MSNPASAATYVVDTSAFMDWQDRWYPEDVFPSLIPLIDGLIAVGRLQSVELVHDELKSMGSTGLVAWANSRKAIFDPKGNHLAGALTIEGRFPAHKDPRSVYDEADAYVIALAQIRGATVVTAETPAATKKKPKRSLYIPDVCSQLGIPCVSNLGMMRREGWQL